MSALVREVPPTPNELAKRQLVADAKNGDDGPDSYTWDTGTPP